MWDLIVSVSDHCLSFYFDDFWILFKIALWTSAGKKLVMFYCMPSLFFVFLSHMSLVSRKPVFGVCDQVRLKPACSASEATS